MADNNMERLMAAASKGLGIPPEKLKEALEKRDIGALTANMSENDRKKVNEVLNNPKMAEQFRKKYGESFKK